MPLDPTAGFLNRFLRRPPQVSGPMNPQQLPPAQPSLPNWMRQGFEGGTDMILGALGVGPETQMNKMGQFMGMAVPMSRGRSFMPPVKQVQPTMDEVNMLIKQMEGNLARIPKGGNKPIYDEAGRLLAFEAPANRAYEAHLASSRGKNVMPAIKSAASSPFAEEQFKKYTSRIR